MSDEMTNSEWKLFRALKAHYKKGELTQEDVIVLVLLARQQDIVEEVYSWIITQEVVSEESILDYIFDELIEVEMIIEDEEDDD